MYVAMVLLAALACSSGFQSWRAPRFVNTFRMSFADLSEQIQPSSSLSSLAEKKVPLNPTVIFVVDTSSPGGGQRIEAVKLAVTRLLPATKVSVVQCFLGGAETVLEPTSSIFNAGIKLSSMQRSVKGNLGAGISLGVATANALLQDSTDSVILAIIADGAAHGLVAGAYGCDLDEEELHPCDNELYDAALSLSTESLSQRNKHGRQLKTLVVDTSKIKAGVRSDSGVRLAKACLAEYIPQPELIGDDLARIVSDCRRAL